LRTSAVLPLAAASGALDDAAMRIDILIYDGFDELDAIAPYEVLRTAGLDVSLVGARGPGTVTADHGTRVVVDRGVSEAADVILVPGGGWNTRSDRGAWGEAQRGEIPALLAAAHARGVVMASVCTGALLLAAAGITNGRPATTHHDAIEDLRATGAQIVEARVVDDGDLITAGGVTSGLDLALALVERAAGREVADSVAYDIEYLRSDTSTWGVRSV
jgi:putative intracellular protease/amidase